LEKCGLKDPSCLFRFFVGGDVRSYDLNDARVWMTIALSLHESPSHFISNPKAGIKEGTKQVIFTGADKGGGLMS